MKNIILKLLWQIRATLIMLKAKIILFIFKIIKIIKIIKKILLLGLFLLIMSLNIKNNISKKINNNKI